MEGVVDGIIDGISEVDDVTMMACLRSFRPVVASNRPEFATPILNEGLSERS